MIEEKVFKAKRDIKYILKEADFNKQDLIIIFSAFSPLGKPPAYNYLRIIDKIDANKLFILDDFGGRASYYLCENKTFDIEVSVWSLIDKIKSELNIKTIISMGSSKGGYAALYFGIKYKFDYVIAASPQYFLAKYLISESNSSDVVKFMTGSSNSESAEFLDSILEKVILKAKKYPNIYLHLGKYEYHYRSHVLPMTKLLDYKDCKFELDLGEYSEHNDVGKYFPKKLIEKLEVILTGPKIEITTNKIPQDDFKIGDEVVLNFTTHEDNSIAIYEYLNGEKLKVVYYNKQNRSYLLKFNEIGHYQVKGFVKDKQGRIRTKLSETYIIK